MAFPRHPERLAAVFSEDRRYRYWLRRGYGAGLRPSVRRPPCVFILLNPSTANAYKDDPTVRKCMRFAHSWGHREVIITNLFAYRATDPEDMMAAADPVGPDNDEALLAAADYANRFSDDGRSFTSGPIIMAWGNHGAYAGRARYVRRMLSAYPLSYIKLNEGTGEPAHPLYLPADLTYKNMVPPATGAGAVV